MSTAPYIAAHRFGLGANAQEMAVINRAPKDWLYSQLNAGASKAALTGPYKSTDELVKETVKLKDANANKQMNIIKSGYKLYFADMEKRFEHAVETEYPLLERLAMFWSNHFTVSSKGKHHIARIASAFEREAIRPHILGKFSDMLLASTRHPAMTLYLDNVQSIGPNSIFGKRRDKGINENLAREILELHTLGVNGGYTQDDVIGLAKIITGWTIVPPRQGGGGYQYIHAVHEPGTHKLLGKTYSQRGEAQGIVALTDIANHPSTAKFIATKMARHFVADDPPQSSIQKLEQTFLRTGGDLKAMVETLIEMPEVWATPLPKVKKPYEMVVSTCRLTQLPMNKVPFKKIAASLGLLEHLPFQATSPAGYPDTADDWLSPNATINRVEWCHAVAQAIRPQENPYELAKATIGPVANADTMLWISRAPTHIDGLALLLASPEWQRR